MRLAPTDTHLVPYQWTTGASRTTAVVGRSVQRACHDVRRQLVEMAAELAGDAPDLLTELGYSVAEIATLAEAGAFGPR